MPDTLPIRPAADTPALAAAVQASAANRAEVYREGWKAAMKEAALFVAGFDAAVNSEAMRPFASNAALVDAVIARDFAMAAEIRALAKDPPDARP